MDALGLIGERVAWCERLGVSVLCCPEGVLGGLADYAADPMEIAIATERVEVVLAPLTSDRVMTIVGFTELGICGRFFNSAAILYQGSVAGIYRKMHPAMRRSVYAAGWDGPVFRVGGLTFGIVICNDSNYPELVRGMADGGARVLFIPSNNGLPVGRVGPEIMNETRGVDVARAVENGIWVMRADVAGREGGLEGFGASGIVGPDGIGAGEWMGDLVVCGVNERVTCVTADDEAR